VSSGRREEAVAGQQAAAGEANYKWTL